MIADGRAVAGGPLPAGVFPWMALASLLCLVDGEELGALGRSVGRRLGWSLDSTTRPPPPCAPMPRGWRRCGAATFSVGHVLSIALVVLPRGKPRHPVRAAVERLAGGWLATTHSIQFWGMFAPNVSRVLKELRAEAVLADGTHVDLGHGFDADPEFGRHWFL